MPRIWRISSPRSTPPRRPTRRTALWAALALLALGFVVIVLIAFGVFPQARVTRLIETRAKQALGEQSRIGRMRVVPARGEAEVWDSVVAGPGYRVELPRARFVFGLGALFGGELVIQKLELENPRVVIDPVPGSGGAKGRPITVLDMRVSHGSLLYKDLAGGDLQLVDVSGSGGIGRGILELRAASGEWRRPVRVPLGPLHARVALTPRLEARLESLDAATGSSRIHLSGAIGALSDPVLDLAFEADVDLKDAQLFGGPSETTGRVHTRGRISGSPRDLRVEAHGTSPRVDSGGLTLHGVDADLELGGDTRKTLQLASRIGASVPDVWGGTTRGNVTLSGAYTPSLSRTELRWRAALERRPPGTRAPGPGFVTARAEGTASGGTPLRIDGRMSGEVVSPGASAPLRVPFTGTFASLGRRIAADFDLRQAPGFLRASLDADAGAIKSLRLRGEDLDLVPLLGASGRASLNAAFSGQPQRASGSASASVRGLAYRGSSLGDAALRLSLRNGRGPLQLELPALRARGTGELLLAGGGSLRASVTLDRTPLAPLAAAFQTTPAAPLLGELTAVADVTATLADWRRAEIRLNASQLALQNGTLQARAGPFTAVARDGVADVQGLSLELPGGRLEASGRLALGAGTNDLLLRVAADVQNVPNLKLPQGWQIQGRATGQLRLTGSFERPWLVGNVQLLDLALRRGQRQLRIFELPKAELLAQGDRIGFTDVTATLAGGSVKASGELRLSTVAPTLFPQGDLAQPAQLQVEWHDVRADVLSRAFGWRGDQVVDAALSGHFVVEGRRARLLDLSGHGSMAAVHGTAAGVPFDVDELAVRVERGIATLDSFTLRTGTETLRGNATLDASSLALTGSATGKVDLRALSALTSPAYLSGDAGVDVRLAGTLWDPKPSGRITLDQASARSPEFAQALTEMNGVLLLEPGLWRLDGVTGRFGGGDVRVTGSLRPVGPSTWADVNFAITAKDVALRYPEDFKSRVSAELRLVGETGALQLQGTVLVDGGLYDKDIFLDQALRETDESLLRPALSPLVEPLAPLRAIGLDVEASLVNPFLVRNNLAKLAVTGQIRVRGDLAEPAPYGRLEIAEGGQLFLQTRTFTVEGGSLIYEGTREPTISVTAQGVIKQAGQEDLSVTVAASGPLMRPRLALNSDPPYTEREIASLIATGRRNVALDSSSWVVGGEQVAALLAGHLTRGVQRGLLDLGLDEVDIQPELLARETNPGARFTFGKNVTPDMKLIFSRGLKDPESTFYQLEYRMRALYDVTARVQSDDHASITYGLGQRFRWGASKKPKSEVLQEKRVTLKAVSFSGDKALGEDVLRDAIRVKVGDDVTPWDIQDDADRLERLLVDAQYIEALVSARVEDDSAVFAISAGPRFRAEVVGMPQAPPLETTLKEARFEGEALDRGRKVLLDAARTRGYGRAKVDAAARDDPGWRTLSFKVELGPPTQVTVQFPGARALSTQRLITAAGGASEFLTAPQRARRLVTREYRAALYLGALVGEPEVTESADHGSVSIAVPVQEGAKAKIARVRFDGAQTPESVLVPLTGIAPGSDYLEDKVLLAVQRVREYYLKNGYASVRLRHRLVPAAPDVELHFQINEGEPDTIGAVVVTGLRRTRESLVRNRIGFKQGDPLDPRKLVELERRLMELGMFSRVAVSAAGENPRTIKVEVEERGPYMVNYDLRFSQDERATVLLDGEIGNLGGLGIVAGGRYRQGLALREARGSLVLPALGRARGITLSAFDRAQDVGLTGEPRRRTSVGPFERRTERGAGLQHSLQLRNKWETAYSYTLKRVGTTAGSALQKNLGILEASIVADGRDDPLNPTRGVFWSVSLGLSPKQLGSQLPFSRVMGQASVTLPVGRQLTWAQGYRLGVATVLKGKTLEEIRLIGREEGFRAGGGSSVRGYATDSLGPRDLLPGTAAGDAVAIVNQELRYQLPAGFGAAVFYDAGNVFAHKEALTLKLRQSVGVGVRYLSPFGLVRVDVGFPIARRPGEKPQIFLSLGQAF